jgi:hypothetical protein
MALSVPTQEVGDPFNNTANTVLNSGTEKNRRTKKERVPKDPQQSPFKGARRRQARKQ